MSHKKIFTEIYKNNVWGGSGGGSSPEATKTFRSILEQFLNEKNIKTVVDFGCGDWSSTRLINWESIEYIGVDVVHSVIQENKKKYSSENIDFKEIAGKEDVVNFSGDLLIVKDVLMHWCNGDVIEFINAARPNYKHIILINTSIGATSERPNTSPQFQPLSYKEFPLNLFSPKLLKTYCDVSDTLQEREIVLISEY
jgi:SAM-dependent methyltransferase